MRTSLVFGVAILVISSASGIIPILQGILKCSEGYCTDEHRINLGLKPLNPKNARPAKANSSSTPSLPPTNYTPSPSYTPPPSYAPSPSYAPTPSFAPTQMLGSQHSVEDQLRESQQKRMELEARLARIEAQVASAPAEAPAPKPAASSKGGSLDIGSLISLASMFSGGRK